MATNDDILKKLDQIKNNDQFKVPEGYFDRLSGNIMNRIKEDEAGTIAEETSGKTSPKRSVIYLVRNQLAIAASFAALFLLAYTAIKIIVPQSPKLQLSENEIIASLEAEIHDIDEVLLYDLAYENTPAQEVETFELSEQEIMDYLMEEGADIDFDNLDF